ncbi:MAG TPA: metalloregulator ArsR/SmtB family transcription factor [Sphingomonadaceae bacterium]|nr:metalloregulator ArsR/SmtB family transcription factor [Sphingomonadaceae bacterium]
MANNHASLDLAFHALADPTRRAVLGRLIEGPAPVAELAGPFAMGLPAFLKHIRVLEESGWIASEKQGRVRTCRILPERLRATEEWLTGQRKVWEARTDRLAVYAETHLATEEQP